MLIQLEPARRPAAAWSQRSAGHGYLRLDLGLAVTNVLRVNPPFPDDFVFDGEADPDLVAFS